MLTVGSSDGQALACKDLLSKYPAFEAPFPRWLQDICMSQTKCLGYAMTEMPASSVAYAEAWRGTSCGLHGRR